MAALEKQQKLVMSHAVSSRRKGAVTRAPKPRTRRQAAELIAASTFGLFSAISAAVRKHGTIAALLFLAFFAGPFRASAQTCSMTMPVRTMDCSADCCAKMKSCVLAQQHPVQPRAATATAPKSSVVMIAPALHEVMAPMFDAPLRPTHFLIVQAPAHTPPPLALFCTLVI